MIRNDDEFKEAVERLAREKRRIADQTRRLKETGLSRDEINRVMDPVRSFHLQLVEEVESYRRLKRGEFAELRNFQGLGRLLTAARISRGLTQREFARLSGVNESQVSRDERNEYHGITVDRAARILEVLGVELVSHAERVGLTEPETIPA